MNVLRGRKPHPEAVPACIALRGPLVMTRPSGAVLKELAGREALFAEDAAFLAQVGGRL